MAFQLWFLLGIDHLTGKFYTFISTGMVTLWL